MGIRLDELRRWLARLLSFGLLSKCSLFFWAVFGVGMEGSAFGHLNIVGWAFGVLSGVHFW